jgi:hypothetical protein
MLPLRVLFRMTTLIFSGSFPEPLIGIQIRTTGLQASALPSVAFKMPAEKNFFLRFLQEVHLVQR